MMFIKPTAEDHIRDVLARWAETTRSGRRDEVLSRYAHDVVIFDVLPPLKYEGAEAYRRSWDDWQRQTVGEALFDIHELHITAGEDVAFAHGLIHCGGTHDDGSAAEDWVRATFCLRKIGGRWMITHQHVSMPIGSDARDSQLPTATPEATPRSRHADGIGNASVRLNRAGVTEDQLQ